LFKKASLRQESFGITDAISADGFDYDPAFLDARIFRNRATRDSIVTDKLKKKKRR